MSVSTTVASLLGFSFVGYTTYRIWRSGAMPPPPRFRHCDEADAYGFVSGWVSYRPALLASEEHYHEWKSRQRPSQATIERLNHDLIPSWYRGTRALDEGDYNALNVPEMTTHSSRL